MKIITRTMHAVPSQNVPGFVYFEHGYWSIKLSDTDWRELGKPAELVVHVSTPSPVEEQR